MEGMEEIGKCFFLTFLTFPNFRIFP